LFWAVFICSFSILSNSYLKSAVCCICEKLRSHFIFFEQQSHLTPALHSKAPQNINHPSLLQETCGSLQWEMEQAVCDEHSKSFNMSTHKFLLQCIYLSAPFWCLREVDQTSRQLNIHVSANFFWMKDMRFFPAKASVFTEEPTISKSAFIKIPKVFGRVEKLSRK